MDRVEFKAEMETLLGGNLVDVELIEDDYDVAFSRAKRKFQQHGNHNLDVNFYTLPVLTGVQEYTLTSEVNEVTRVIKPGSSFYSNNPHHVSVLTDLISPLYGSNASCGGGGAVGDLLVYDLTMAYLETIDNLGVKEVRFHYNPINKRLFIEQQPVADQTWLLETFSALTDEEYREMFWIQEWALAELKIILGRAYRKFPNLDTPSGENTLDGAELVQEGREDKERLLEDIKNYVDSEANAQGGIIIM